MDTLSELAASAAAQTLTGQQIASASGPLGLSQSQLHDAIAVYLAQGFLAGELSFEFCDTAIVHIMGLYNYSPDLPDLTWDIWSAFDDGEWVHPEDPEGADPPEHHTRPEIARILGQSGHMPEPAA